MAGDVLETVRRLAQGETIRIHPISDQQDRYARLRAHVFLINGAGEKWLQGALLESGLVQAAPRRGETDCLNEMRQAEAIARQAHRGLWGHEAYRILDGTRTEMPLGSFRIVEGKVLSAARRGKVLYLNFGRRWRTDFTVRMTGAAAQSFDPEKMDGRSVRVRGWIEDWNGPVIKMTYKEQLEILPSSMHQSGGH